MHLDSREGWSSSLQVKNKGTKGASVPRSNRRKYPSGRTRERTGKVRAKSYEC